MPFVSYTLVQWMSGWTSGCITLLLVRAGHKINTRHHAEIHFPVFASFIMCRIYGIYIFFEPLRLVPTVCLPWKNSEAFSQTHFLAIVTQQTLWILDLLENCPQVTSVVNLHYTNRINWLAYQTVTYSVSNSLARMCRILQLYLQLNIPKSSVRCITSSQHLIGYLLELH